MRLLVATLLVIPRAAMIVWWVVDPSGFSAAFWQSQIWPLAFFVCLPYAGLLLLITAPGGMDTVDWIMVGFASVSDVLTYSTWRYSLRSTSTAKAVAGVEEPGETAAAKSSRQIRSMNMRGRLARYLPWPGMRLNSAKKYWRGYDDLPDEDQRLLEATAYRSTKSSIAASSHLWIAFLILLAYANNSGISREGMVLIAFLGPVVTVGVIVAVGHLNADFRVVLPLVELLAGIERLSGWPADTREIRGLNGDIEKIAEAIQKLPLRLGSNHRTVIEAGASRAAAMRDLQAVVSFGPADGAENLRTVLTDDLKKVLRGRWVQLPSGVRSTENQGLTRLQKAAFVLLALCSIAGATWVGFNGGSWGSGSGLVISILVTLAITCLIKSGLAPGGLQQAIDASKGLKG